MVQKDKIYLSIQTNKRNFLLDTATIKAYNLRTYQGGKMFKAVITHTMNNDTRIDKSEFSKESVYEIALEIEDSFDETKIREIHITREA